MSDKYFRTPHLPWSQSVTRDDRTLHDLSGLIGVEVVITEKLDGSNICLTNTDVFARSHSGTPIHPSFDALKAFHARQKHQIEGGVSIFGEWCYAVHSIQYDAINELVPHIFGVRDDATGFWLDWEFVELFAQTIEAPTVPVLFKGVLEDEAQLRAVTEALATAASTVGHTMREGIVIRVADMFSFKGNTPKQVAKWVRANHVQPNVEHWMSKVVQRQGKDF